MDLQFDDQSVLVVGGSSGIGNGIAHAFRQRGAAAWVWGTRPPEAYADVPDADLEGLTYRQVDATDAEAVHGAVAEMSRLDVVVCCQGTVRYGRQEFEPEGWAQVMDTNINSVMTCATAAYPKLVATEGSLIIVSSVAGFRATVGNPAYSASKHAAVGLTRSLAAAWAAEGVRVNGLAPGLVDTKLTKVTTENPKRLAATLRTIPQQRLGTPADMAGVALFLASPLASYVTGQTVVCDGGLTLS